MLRWFEAGIKDGDIFRRRCRWAMTTQWLLQLATVIAILLTR
jgi:hypothetical protein